MKKIILVAIIVMLFSLIGCDNKKEDNKEVNELIEAINELPDENNLSLDDEENINELLYKYNILSEDDKEKITNYSKLLNAQTKMAYLNVVEENLIFEIDDLISELPKLNRISLKDKEDILAIEELIAKVSQKGLLNLSYLDVFNQAKEKIQMLEREIKAKEEAEVVIELINNLPLVKDISIDKENTISDVRSKYDALQEDAKSFVTNYETLVQVEEVLNLLKSHTEFTIQEVLDCISDVIDIDTKDTLITSTANYKVEWSSSNEQLLNVSEGVTKVSKIYQNHTLQVVTIDAKITFNNNDVATLSKEVMVSPIVYEELPDTPVATYFQTGALSTYLNYSERYKKEGTIFSDKAKEVLNILYYAFAYPTESGDVYISSLDILPEVMKLKESGTRIIMCISGVSGDGSKIFKSLTSDPSKRAKFVSNIVKTIDKYNFDGVDIDWESSAGAYVVAKNMNELMRDIRKKLDENQAKGGTPYLLSAAIPATSWGTATDRFDFATLNKYVDYINMMSYDLNNPDKATHLSALYTSSSDKGYGFSVEYGVNLYTSRGLDKEKIIIGAAGYGKAYKITSYSSSDKYPGIGSVAKLTALQGVPGSYASGTVFLNGIEVLIKSGKYEKYIEYNNNRIVGSYLYNAEEQIVVTYDSEEVMSEKYKYALNNEGMGIMCWAYTEDTTDSYINSIYEIKNN